MKEFKNQKELMNFIEKRFKIIKESFNGNFDSNEFEGEAMRAAMGDMDDFTPLGKSQYDKFDPNDFTADLNRQNLNLPNDRKEISNIEKSMDRTKSHEKKFGRGTMNEEPENIDRPMDSNNQPITLKARVKDLDTDSIGRVIRFGVDDNNKQTVHVEWNQNFGGAIPKTITYPDRVLVQDNSRVVKEEEIEEGMGHSHTIGKGANAKPSNYPEALKREGLSESAKKMMALAGIKEDGKKFLNNDSFSEEN